MKIREATLIDLDHIVILFDAYRQFYKQNSDLDKAREFITDRLTNKESVIYLVFIKGTTENKQDIAIGFTQLYPIFSSVSMERTLLLNDLYIDTNYRGAGAGTALINKAKDLCRAKNLKGLTLQTEIANPAQKLYEHLDFKKDSDLHYFWSCD